MNARRGLILSRRGWIIKGSLALAVLVTGSVLSQRLLAQNKDKKEDANQRTIEGVVTDMGNNPIPRAIVQLKDMRTLQIRSFVSQAQGNYHFAGLRMDTDYELKATLGDQTSATKRVSSFESRKTVTVNLQLGNK